MTMWPPGHLGTRTHLKGDTVREKCCIATTLNANEPKSLLAQGY